MSGFKTIDVIDMDTIDVSNLNRQFLFRPRDVGKPKAEVAAARVMERVAGVTVNPHFARIEDKPNEWYNQFHIIILGLDSLEARSYMNGVACSFLEYTDDGEPDQATIKPMVDGGTEGFKGHARVILPGVTPCFQCTMWLFPPQANFPLCTLAETPRSAAHCIEYAHLIQWGQERGDESFDADVSEHIQWVYERALARADHFGIPGVTFTHTQGVVKNIIPAIPSTNAVVAAACTVEALKMATMCSQGMNNYMLYVGTSGVYTHTVAYERDPECPCCSPGVKMEVPAGATLQDVLDALLVKFPDKLSAPSVSVNGGANLYMRGVLEEEFKPNLSRQMASLMTHSGDGSKPDEKVTEGNLIVNDKKLSGPLRVKLVLK